MCVGHECQFGVVGSGKVKADAVCPDCVAGLPVIGVVIITGFLLTKEVNAGKEGRTHYEPECLVHSCLMA